MSSQFRLSTDLSGAIAKRLPLACGGLLVFRDVISLIILINVPQAPEAPSGGQKVSASPATQASKARLNIYTVYANINRLLILMIILT